MTAPRRSQLAMLFAMLLAFAALASDESAVLQDALGDFDRAVAAGRSDPQRAEELYRRAIARFESLAAAGVHNASLEYNLGCAHFRVRDLGRAILHFRRALRIDPSFTRAAENLRLARERVEPFITPAADVQLFDRLMFWTRDVSIRSRLVLAAAGALVGWGLLVVRRWRARPWLLICGVGAVLLGLANSASVAWQLHDESATPHAVLIAGDQTLRTGRGEGYEAVLKQPLGAGVEVRILNRRAEWVEVRLVNGVRGWLPESAVAEILPTPARR